MRFRHFPITLSLALLAVTPPAMAQGAHTHAAAAPFMTVEPDVDARVRTLEEQVRALQRQLDELKGTRPADTPGTDATTETEAEPDAGAEEHGHPMGGPGLSLGNVTLSGMLEMQFTTAVAGSLKQPVFANPKGNSDFILTHVHPMLHANLSDEVNAMIMWCLTHVGTTAVYEAYLGYAPNDSLDLKAGRFLLPFGAWNPISNPANYKTISRPLMYLGHEERNIVLQGGPRPILNDEHSDIGLLLNGRKEIGTSLLSWSAWAGNGMHDLYGDFTDAWIDFRPSEDNNGEKSLGARLAWTTGGLTLGGSYTDGKYDALGEYDYHIWELDATWRGPSGLTLRAEYASNPYERGETGELPDARRYGWFAMAESPIAPKWTGVLLYSTLTERPAENVETVRRLTLGANYQLTPTTTIKTEVGRLLIGGFVGNLETAPQGGDYDDVTTFKVSTVVSF